MATTDVAVKYDIAFIEELYEYLPKHIKSIAGSEHIISYLSSQGLIQRDRLFELALAENSNGKYIMCSKAARDFTDDSDAKSVTVNYREKDGRITPNVIITNIRNKVGALRVMADDEINEEFRYYYIFDYDSVRAYDRIEFSILSNSKYNNGECGYELDSFAQLAQF